MKIKSNPHDGIHFEISAFGYTALIVPKFKLFLVWNRKGSAIIHN